MLETIPNGPDGAAYLSVFEHTQKRTMRRNPGSPGRKEHAWVRNKREERRFAGAKGAHAVVQLHFDMVRRLEADRGTSLFPGDMVAFTGAEVAKRMRPKTARELAWDEMMLWTEIGAYDEANAAYQRSIDSGVTVEPKGSVEDEGAMYWHILACRLADGQANALNNAGAFEQAQSHLDEAARHAAIVVENFTALTHRLPDPGQHAGYYFGARYRNAAMKLVAACDVLVRLLLGQHDEDEDAKSERVHAAKGLIELRARARALLSSTCMCLETNGPSQRKSAGSRMFEYPATPNENE